MELPVILINPFEVPEGKDDEFLIHWSELADRLRQEPGFTSTRLHKSLDPKAKFRYVNVAEWESREAFERATGKVIDQEYRAKNRELIPWSNPALYEIIKR